MLRSIAFLALAATLGAVPLAGQGWIDPVSGLERPSGLMRTRSHVQVTLQGRIARIEVEEWFHNLGGGLAEGDYTYPLPGEAVFSNVSLFQGDTELTGETMDAGEARAIYEEIVRRKRDPALIELVGHGLIRARVFPIPAGQTRKITLRFTQVLDRAGDALRFQYAAGSRTPGNTAVSRNIPRTAPERSPISFELTASEGDRFGNPFSPTTRLEYRRNRGLLSVHSPDISGDLTLFLPLARDLIGITIATHRPTTGEPGYFMMTLSPDRGTTTSIPRDLTVAIDISGSMSGAKITQAKAALHQILQSLGNRDRFRLTAFSNTVLTQSNGWLNVTHQNLETARDWVDRLRADGGTNIDGALVEALRLESPESRLPVVLFLTDGLPSVGEQDPDRIAHNASSQRGRARIFAFGVGYDVNTQLLDQLSVEGRGATEYVAPGESVERSLGYLANKIQHPVLTDLTIDESPVRLTEVYPTKLPDLFAGEELIVFGRYEVRSNTRGEVAIGGRRSRNAERFSTTADFPTHQLSNEFVPRLWAARKLGFLTRTLRLEGRTDELVEEIRSTALRYGLLSEFTSYLVQEPEFVAFQSGAGGIRPQRRDRPSPASPRRMSGSVDALTGQAAVESAKRAGEQRVVSSEADLKALNDVGDTREETGSVKRVAGRTFELRHGVWTDVIHREHVRMVTIKAFSDAYFDLLTMVPELQPWLVEFDHVLLAGSEASIRIAADGDETLTDREINRLVQEFRGR